MAKETATTSLSHQLHRAAQIVDLYFFAIAKDLRITTRQLVVLQILTDHPGASQTDLVNRSGIDRSTMADLVKRLLRLDLAKRRRRKDDARAYEITITAEGAKSLASGLIALRASEEELKRLLGHETAQLSKILEGIAALPAPPEGVPAKNTKQVA